MPDNPHDDDPLHVARRAALSPLLSTADFRPLSAAVRVEIGASSHQGPSRSLNDDHYVAIRFGRSQETVATSLSAADLPPRFEEHGYAMLVADGLGEPGAGSVASRVALSTIAHLGLQYGRWNMRIHSASAWDIVQRLEWFLAQADAAVSEKRRAGGPNAGIATALSAAFSAGDDLFVAHVGHSRVYLFRQGALTQLTRDGTVEQHMRDSRHPAGAEGRADDFEHILTDAIGARAGSPVVDVEQFHLLDGDCVMLCTNGLTDAVDDDRIADVLALRRQPDEASEILTKLAGQEGGQDNVTVIVAQYHIPQS